MLKATSCLLAAICVCFMIWVSWREIQLNDAFGSSIVVGIALTANHAALSCKHTNGSFEDLGRIEGTAEYIALMRRLSSWDSWHLHPPYRSLGDLGNDYPRQMRRRARKAAGLPASSDVAILASVLKSIIDVVGNRTELPLSALVSFPALPGLYQEDIADAAIYVGLHQLRDGYGLHPHELVATYAAHGFGLKNGSELLSGDKSFPTRPTLLVEYTEIAFLLHHDFMGKAIELQWPSIALRTSLAMGSDHSPDEIEIRNHVIEFLWDEYLIREPDDGRAPETVTVLITGSSKSLADGRLQNATRTAVDLLHSRIEMFSHNPEYIAARGAAELAWRALKSEENGEL
ncbi:hypothetical protein BKA63DRAFT_279190 [Paraphoma chrysanthemicola]|nr:hypothetical protein BKA63DRAFT_279190 [Paraphoma chrysanthemicola]